MRLLCYAPSDSSTHFEYVSGGAQALGPHPFTPPRDEPFEKCGLEGGEDYQELNCPQPEEIYISLHKSYNPVTLKGLSIEDLLQGKPVVLRHWLMRGYIRPPNC